jgi:DNA-nicking Smr family endonuclease
MTRRPPDNDSKGRKPTREELLIWNHVTQQDSRLPHAEIDWQEVAETLRESVPTEGATLPPASQDQLETLLVQPFFDKAGAAHAPPATTGGVDRNSARRLRQGKLAIEASLDLHGMTREQAHSTLVGFLGHSFELQRRCVLVITGKGRFRAEAGSSDGILRNHLPRWLALPPCTQWVLRHERAQPHHGGDGAFYILLRRKR